VAARKARIGRAFKQRRKQMKSIKSAFTCAAATNFGFGSFWLLLFVIAIIDDADRREEQRRKCRQLAKPQKPAGPTP
jgi:hypothetical protein